MSFGLNFTYRCFLAQVAWSRLLGSLVHNELDMMWKEVVVA